MNLLNTLILSDYLSKEQRVEPELKTWLIVVQAALWSDEASLKSCYPNVERDGEGCWLFFFLNKKYRIRADIYFDVEVVIIREFSPVKELNTKKRRRDEPV